jgi:hypothetical protein
MSEVIRRRSGLQAAFELIGIDLTGARQGLRSKFAVQSVKIVLMIHPLLPHRCMCFG